MRSSPRSSWLRRRTSALLAGLVSAALVLSGCSVYDAPLPGGAKTGDNPMTIKVMFRDVLDLVPQSTVRVNDVTVGKVKKVDLKGYVAEVTVEIPGDVKLPDNARAEIRQTSLLGEKFVQLSEPRDPGTGKLANGDVIGLDRTGRNPEVEEVLGALSLLLNGGGVGQLKTIFSELNNAMEGREPQVRSVLTQLRSFMGQLDENKAAIIATIENTNRLALEIRRNDGAIKAALDDIPDALRSVDSQRADLVKLLRSLTRLSGVGVRVIRASKESTINSLRHLGPVLEGFAKAGDNFAKSFQVFATYPFIDEAVGRNPRVARNLHMGDYTNLSVNLDISVTSSATSWARSVTSWRRCSTQTRGERERRSRRDRRADEGTGQPAHHGGTIARRCDELDHRPGCIERVPGRGRASSARRPNAGELLRFGEGQLDGPSARQA